MPQQPGRGRQKPLSPEEQAYRQKLAAKEKKRQQRIKQQLVLLGAGVLFLVLFILCIVMVVRAIKNPSDPGPATQSAASLPGEVEDAGANGSITWPVAPDPTVWNLLLINNKRPMEPGFEPELVSVTAAGHMFDARAADALKQMVDDCNAVEGHSLAIDSAYRGETTQNQKYNAVLEVFKGIKLGEGLSDADATAAADVLAREVEPPFGYSDHQTGLAVDFITDRMDEPAQAFSETLEYAWLMANAQDYGFILRFPDSKVLITGIGAQPYHFRYVGVEDAKIITGAGICLEEYLVQLPESTSASAGEAPVTSSALPPESTENMG